MKDSAKYCLALLAGFDVRGIRFGSHFGRKLRYGQRANRIDGGRYPLPTVQFRWSIPLRTFRLR